MRILVFAVLIALAACATNPPVEGKQTIEQVAEDLSGKEIRLQSPHASDASTTVPALSGARDPAFGYAGLKQGLNPACAHCEANGGVLHIAERRSFSKASPQLPARLQCRSGKTLLWQPAMHYTEKKYGGGPAPAHDSPDAAGKRIGACR